MREISAPSSSQTRLLKTDRLQCCISTSRSASVINVALAKPRLSRPASQTRIDVPQLQWRKGSAPGAAVVPPIGTLQAAEGGCSRAVCSDRRSADAQRCRPRACLKSPAPGSFRHYLRWLRENVGHRKLKQEAEVSASLFHCRHIERLRPRQQAHHPRAVGDVDLCKTCSSWTPNGTSMYIMLPCLLFPMRPHSDPSNRKRHETSALPRRPWPG